MKSRQVPTAIPEISYYLELSEKHLIFVINVQGDEYGNIPEHLTNNDLHVLGEKFTHDWGVRIGIRTGGEKRQRRLALPLAQGDMHAVMAHGIRTVNELVAKLQGSLLVKNTQELITRKNRQDFAAALKPLGLELEV